MLEPNVTVKIKPIKIFLSSMVCFLPQQILPKLTSSIVHDVDGILGNKPYSKKDYRS